MTKDLELQLRDYRFTTAEIIYRLPDHVDILQTYVWQEIDLLPEFPALKKFLDFWTQQLDGPLHSVRIAHTRLLEPSEIRKVDTELILH